MVVLLFVSKKNLPLALFSAAIVLGIFTIPLRDIGMKIYETLIDPSIILLAIAMGLIPLIGGIMEESGQMDGLVNNLRIGKKPFLAISPALIGMLPVPGGALLSAPLVEKVGKEIKPEVKASLNVWFRHVLFLIYPISSVLIVSTKIAGLEVYDVLPYLFPFFIFSLLIGYIFFLRGIEGKITYAKKFSIKDLMIPLTIIILVPIIDFSIQKIFDLPIREISLIIAVIASLLLSLLLSDLHATKVLTVSKKMRIWYFALIIVGMFAFLNIFKASGVPEMIASANFSKIILCVVIGFLLGLVTGRIQVPASIIIPIYLTSSKLNFMQPSAFAITFFSIFLGYVISPIHPCVSVSVEYFKTQIKDFLKASILPVFRGFLIVLTLGWFVIG
jgi:integral membrane protein (TIGR00529 family)